MSLVNGKGVGKRLTFFYSEIKVLFGLSIYVYTFFDKYKHVSNNLNYPQKYFKNPR